MTDTFFMLASLLSPCTGGDLDQRSGRRQRKHTGGCTTLRLHWKRAGHLISGLFKPKAKAASPRPSLADQGGGKQIFLLLWSPEGKCMLTGNNSSSHDLAPKGNNFCFLFLLQSTILLFSTCHHRLQIHFTELDSPWTG